MSATELFTSRVGGDLSRTRRFKVITTNDPGKEDPLFDSQLPPMGTGHSKFPGLIAKARNIAQRLSTKTFFVDVAYGLPDALTASFGGLWQVSATGSSESHRQFFSTLDSEQLSEGVEPEIVGPYDYVELPTGPLPEGEENKYETTTTKRDPESGLVTETVVRLKRLPTRRKEGMDVTSGVGTLNLKRRFTRNINFGKALSRISMVNSDTFYGAAPGQLKFLNIVMTPILVSQFESPYGIGHDVNLSCEWRASGHQHRQVHTYISPTGAESVVRRTKLEPGETKKPPVIETFSTYLQISFNALISEI